MIDLINSLFGWLNMVIIFLLYRLYLVFVYYYKG